MKKTKTLADALLELHEKGLKPTPRRERGLMNYTSLPGSMNVDPDEKPEVTRARARYWSTLRKKVQAGAYIR